MRFLRCCLAVLVLCGPAEASAQLGVLDEVVKRFTDLGLWTSWGGIAPKSATLRPRSGKSGSQNGLRAYGTEFSFEIGTVTRPVCPLEESETGDCVPPKLKPGQWLPTKRTCTIEPGEPKEVHVERRGRQEDTTRMYAPEEKCDVPRERPEWLLELAFGYTQSSSLSSANPAVTMSGVLKESPSVSVYATYLPTEHVSPYFGIRTGLIKLDNLQLDGADTTFSASPESVQAGAVVGAVYEGLPGLPDWPVHLFVESGYVYRTFRSVAWTPAASLPADAPKTIRMSGWYIGLGIQMQVRDSAKE